MRQLLAIMMAVLVQFTPAASHASEDWSHLVAADDARADLRALYSGLESAHFDLFVNRSREDYDALFEQTLATFNQPLSRLELWRSLQAFTAFGNVAHAKIDFPTDAYGEYRAQGGKAFPIYLKIDDGRAYISENYSASEAVSEGDEILAINDEPIRAWLDRTASYISADIPYIAHSLLESGFPMYLWLVTGERETFELRLRKSNSLIMSAQVAALSYDDLLARIEVAPDRFTLDYTSREARMLDGSVGYLRPGPFYNVENPEKLWDNSAMIEFVDAAFESFIASKASTLVLDLRNNPGGDNSFSDPIIAWVADEPFSFASSFLVRSSNEAAASNQARLDAGPDATGSVSAMYAEAFSSAPRGQTFKFEIPIAQPRKGDQFGGSVYVLVNRNSYSNAVNTAAIFQDYGWGTIVGEPTADFATTYGAMESFTLPHTGFKVSFPKAHIIRPSGDTQPGGVQPDIFISSPIVATASDTVLERLLEIIRDD